MRSWQDMQSEIKKKLSKEVTGRRWQLLPHTPPQFASHTSSMVAGISRNRHQLEMVDKAQWGLAPIIPLEPKWPRNVYEYIYIYIYINVYGSVRLIRLVKRENYGRCFVVQNGGEKVRFCIGESGTRLFRIRKFQRVPFCDFHWRVV